MKITHPKADCTDERHVYSWYAVNYSKNHVVFKFTENDQYISGGKWVNRPYDTTGYVISFRKVLPNKVTVNTNMYYYTIQFNSYTGRYIPTSHSDIENPYTIITRNSAYYIFLNKKWNGINYMIKLGDMKWYDL